MSWFEDQVNYRELRDEEVLSEAFIDMAGAVVGRRLQQAWQDESYAAKTALQEICKFYHIKCPEIPDNIRELDAQLDYVFQPRGITRRIVRLKAGWQNDAVGAMLATRKADGKVVALIPGKTGGYTFQDIDSGRIVHVNSRNASALEEEALVFYKPLPLRKISLKDLMQYMLGVLDFSDFLWFFVAMAAVTGLGLLAPKLSHMLFYEVVAYRNTGLLIAVVCFLISASVSSLLVGAIRTLLMTRINTKLNLAVQAASMMRVLSLPAEFFKGYTSGELNQIVEYMNQMCDLMVSAVFNTGFTGLFSLVYIAQISQYAPALVAPALLILIATLFVSFVTIIIQSKTNKIEMEIKAKEQGMLYALVSGIRKIRLSGAEKRVFARWGKLYTQEAQSLYNPATIVKFNTVIVTAISLIGTIVMYDLAVRSGVSQADYYSFTTAYGYVSTAFTALAGIASTIAVLRPILLIIKPLLEAVPEVQEGKEVITRVTGRIELSHVSFRYEEEAPWILNDISLKIRPGQYIAVVGKTGCGKSTLMRLLLGFEKAQKGAIYYDGIDMDRIDKKSLRRKIGVVIQNSKLVWGDIFSNITIAAPWLTMDDAWEAAEIADIADDIRDMPMGMHTIIQEGSGGISGGQKQRLIIARAVASKPKILFMDEATSALDNITQKKVSEALNKMKCTRIVIAHRLSTIRQCDRIIVLSEGKIIEDGTYDQLIEANGFFAKLVSRQRLDV